MRTVHISGVNYQVIFDSRPVGRLAKDGFEPVEQICCRILATDCVQMASGIALRAARDPQDDIVGLRLALRRALDMLTKRMAPRHPFGAKERALFWTAFTETVEAVKRQEEAREQARQNALRQAREIEQEQDRQDAQAESAAKQAAVTAALDNVSAEEEEATAAKQMAEAQRQRRIDALANAIRTAAEKWPIPCGAGRCATCQSLQRELEQLKDDAA